MQEALNREAAASTPAAPAGLQASFEVVYNRKLNVERLQLQNSLLRTDLEAIDIPPAQVLTIAPGAPNDQPQP